MTLAPDDVARSIARIGRSDDFDVAVIGYSDRTPASEYERAGATWWLESVHDMRGTFEEMLELVAAGPG
jgi:hypothetical protein